jgi:Zeta toxin
MRRPLDNIDLLSHFLEGILGNNGTDSEIQYTPIINKIVEAEMTMERLFKKNNSPTLTHTEYRDNGCKSDRERTLLRKQIVKELSSKKRLPKDDKIRIGKGGALPLSECKYERQAFIVTGLPASGKSGVSERIADYYGAAIIDSDYAKRKLPEYANFNIGASIIHEESGAIVFGHKELMNSNFIPLLDKLSENGTNIVIPKIGHDKDSIIELVIKLKEVYNYEVHLTLVSLDKRKATIRALKRFQETKRYVPLSYIYDTYGNEPILSYYRIKREATHLFKSIGKISTDVPIGNPYVFIENIGDNPSLLYK